MTQLLEPIQVFKTESAPARRFDDRNLAKDAFC